MLNAAVTATRLRSRADEMDQAGYPKTADAVREVAKHIESMSRRAQVTLPYDGANPWVREVACEC